MIEKKIETHIRAIMMLLKKKKNLYDYVVYINLYDYYNNYGGSEIWTYLIENVLAQCEKVKKIDMKGERRNEKDG